MDITFGELVRTKRELLGLSMRELARRTSVDVAYVSKIEKGQALNPNFSVVMRIARELSINIDMLQKLFDLNEDMDMVISGQIHKSVPEEEKEVVQGIVEGIVKITDNPDFDIEGIGALLQKAYNLHQQKQKVDNMYYIINIVEKEWLYVLETPVVDSQLLSLYCQAYELNEENSFIVQGEILHYPDYFNENQILTLQELLDKCNSVHEDDEMYIPFVELKEYLE